MRGEEGRKAGQSKKKKKRVVGLIKTGQKKRRKINPGLETDSKSPRK